LIVCPGGDILQAQDKSTAEIQNRFTHVVVQLPDREHGAYQGTRFDWSGIVESIQFAGHEYIGKWHDVSDPKVHDAVTGPAEEFLINDSALGYADTKPGEVFPRIGIGTVRKPNGESVYRRYSTYDIVDPGTWSIHRAKDRIESTHQLTAPNGYAYLYRKTLRIKERSVLEIAHSLKNTGQKVIETSQYSHNFFPMGGQIVGPDVTVRFGFPATASSPLKYGAEIKNQAITYAQELQPHQTAASDIVGFDRTPKSYDIRVENRRTGTGVHITGDQAIEMLHFWSIRTVACPEPYVHIRVEPGREAHWTLQYEFYTLDAAVKAKQ
jgi:hypothetical protein